MKLRKLRRIRSAMNGWPNRISFRDKGEWGPDEQGRVIFYRMTAGRVSVTSWPRAAWRGL